MEVSAAPAWAAALEASGFGDAMRDSLYLYPLANLIHILGFILLIGPILVLDLRLLGVGRGIAIPAAAPLLSRLSASGLVLMLFSGFCLFTPDARPLAANDMMWQKWSLIALGVANALAFQAIWTKRYATWDEAPPAIGRAQAAASIALWLAVATFGRLLAYL